MNPSVTRFGLIRHATTTWNEMHRIQGQHDSPLAPFGEQQGERWGEMLAEIAWDRILASDLGRTARTAELVNRTLKLPVSFDKRLREQDWGAWVGKTGKELAAETPDFLARIESEGWRFRPPGGEDRHGVWERSREALLEAAARWPGEAILVIAHGGVLKSLIYKLAGRRFLPSEPPILKDYHLHWLAAPDGRELHLLSLNALDLDGAGDPAA